MVRSISSNEDSYPISSARACSDASAPVGSPLSPRGGRRTRPGSARSEHAAARELLRRADAGWRRARAALGGLRDQRAQLLVFAVARADLDDAALLEQLRVLALRPSSARPKPPARSDWARSTGVFGRDLQDRAVGRDALEPARVRGSGDPTGRPPPSSLQLGWGEAVEHVAVADELVADDLARPSTTRPADDRDAGAASRRRGGERRGPGP